MIIFSITVFPFMCIFINSIINENYRDFRYYRDIFLKGLLTFLPVFPFFILVFGLIKRTNSFSNIYLYHFIYDFAFYYAVINFGYTFLFRNSMVYRFREKISEIFTYECGFFTALSLFDSLYLYKWENPYLLFILPVSRMILAVLFSILTPLISESSGFVRILYIISLFLLPFSVTFITFFYYINSMIVSGIIMMMFISLAAWLFYHNSPVLTDQK